MGRLGLAVIRHGAPVEGIHSGVHTRAKHLFNAVADFAHTRIMPASSCLHKIHHDTSPTLNAKILSSWYANFQEVHMAMPLEQ